MPIDVALLGCAHPHVPDVLGVLASEPDVRLAAVWDADRSAIPGAIAGAAVGRAETAIRRAHAVVICAPTDQRPALCVQAARAGTPLLVEKPIARTAAEARGVAREVERSRTPALAALFLRELPALARLRGVLRERLVGPPGRRDRGPHAPGRGRRLVRRPDRLDARPRARRRGRLRRPRAAPRRRAGSALARRRAAAAGRRRPRPARPRPGRPRRRRRWARGPARRCTVRASWATRPGGLELTRDRRGRHGARCARACSSSRATAASPQRWVGAPPDAGEALRAFTARLRARRFPRAGLTPAVSAQELLEAAVRVG